MNYAKRLFSIAAVVLTGTSISGLQHSEVKAQTTPSAPPTARPSTSSSSSRRPEFPPYADVIKGHEKVVSTIDGKPSMYTLWVRKKDGHVLAEMTSKYLTQKLLFAMTISSGERYAGLQGDDIYAYWKRYDKRLALIEPNVGTRSTGEPESKASVKRLFTDRVLLDVPILTMGPKGGPVIDLNALLLGNSSLFFGVRVQNSRLVTVKKSKAFPSNVEVAFEVPLSRGRLQTLHYSISEIPSSSSYKPRKADSRVGYFTTSYSDLGKYKPDDTKVRYITRWKLEKLDSKLKLSPPKKPIEFYIEHTTPIRYRKWVKNGILYWNKAFEKIGILDAIVVHEQQSRTPARYMDLDPEDVRYNFVRWLNNDIGTAIGPSRIHPLTGEILDADIILTDGWIRHFWRQFNEVLPEIAMEGMSQETLAWLDRRPNWDPRIRLIQPLERDRVLASRMKRGVLALGDYPVLDPDQSENSADISLRRHMERHNGVCTCSRGKSFDLAMLRMTLEMLDDKDDDKDDDKKKDEKKDDKKEPKKPKQVEFDGIPESFVGPLLADLVAHEVGHTLGLRHNFKASGVYSLKEINSAKVKGKPFAGSVMDYVPINIGIHGGEIQGDFGMIDIGPYDLWAIEYGYSLDSDLKPILARVSEVELQYATDEDTGGPDPLARRYDFSSDPLDYAQSQIRLANWHRERLLNKFMKDGDSWAKARRGYEMTLGMQTKSVSMMANWLGGAHVNRAKKGDKNAGDPIVVVSVDRQRAALDFVLATAFRDSQYGLNADLVRKMSVDKWLDGRFFSSNEATWPIHDRIMGIQSSTLTMLLNPTTLERVYDNEFRIDSSKDMVTLPELLDKISSEIWSELGKAPEKKHTARQPMISSLRRNLQREHLERLIDLSLPGAGYGAAYKPISNLAMAQLRAIRGKLDTLAGSDKVDPYTRAHLQEAKVRIDKALDAQYIYNIDSMGGGGGFPFLFFKNPPSTPAELLSPRL